MNDLSTSRRRFLVAAITLSGISSVGPSILKVAQVWAATVDSVDENTLKSMVRMARLMFPHDAISDDVYAEVLNVALSATASDGSFAGVLDAAEQALDARQTADFIDVDEASQIAALKVVEHEDFFVAIQNSVMSHLYYHPRIWELLDYEGPSYQHGGYLHRGAGEINWLPKDE